jgi:hypothetical protein
MIMPTIEARMKKTAKLTAFPANRANITALGSIAKQASISQIIRCRWPSMFFTNNVINFTSPKSIIFMDQAILTKMISAVYNQPPQFSTDVRGAHESDIDERALWLNASDVQAEDSDRVHFVLQRTIR